MEVGDCPAASKSVHFKEPPSFQVQVSDPEDISALYVILRDEGVCLLKVAPCDQVVTEGQDVIISVKTGGQPRPVVYW